MQYKTLSFDTKDVAVNSESRRISGYAAIFGNKDKAGDILIKGCFSKSIQERGPQSNANDKIVHLWMHNMNEPVGKIVTLIEDDKGLYFEADIDKIDLGDREITQLARLISLQLAILMFGTRLIMIRRKTLLL